MYKLDKPEVEDVFKLMPKVYGWLKKQPAFEDEDTSKTVVFKVIAINENTVIAEKMISIDDSITYTGRIIKFEIGSETDKNSIQADYSEMERIYTEEGREKNVKNS